MNFPGIPGPGGGGGQSLPGGVNTAGMSEQEIAITKFVSLPNSCLEPKFRPSSDESGADDVRHGKLSSENRHLRRYGFRAGRGVRSVHELRESLLLQISIQTIILTMLSITTDELRYSPQSRRPRNFEITLARTTQERLQGYGDQIIQLGEELWFGRSYLCGYRMLHRRGTPYT